MSTPHADHFEFIAEQRHPQVQFRVCAVQGARVSAGYRRHREFDRGDHPGQDWCAFRVEGGRCVAVVVDGVSQSFMGDIAARGVGGGLFEHLARLGAQALSAEAVRALLEDLRESVHPQVERFAVGEEIPELVRRTLAEKRATHGSQAVFAALSIDLDTGRGQVFVLGDIVVTVHRAEAPPETLVSDRRARWSDVKGVKGSLTFLDVEGVTGVVLASDGLNPEFGADLGRGAAEEVFRPLAEQGAERDDVSFVSVVLRAPTPDPSIKTTPVVSPDGAPSAAPERESAVGPDSMTPEELRRLTFEARPASIAQTQVASSPSIPVDVLRMPYESPLHPSQPPVVHTTLAGRRSSSPRSALISLGIVVFVAGIGVLLMHIGYQRLGLSAATPVDATTPTEEALKLSPAPSPAPPVKNIPVANSTRSTLRGPGAMVDVGARMDTGVRADVPSHSRSSRDAAARADRNNAGAAAALPANREPQTPPGVVVRVPILSVGDLSPHTHPEPTEEDVHAIPSPTR